MPISAESLYPLLDKAGFSMINVSPRMVYVDSSRPQLVEGFIKNTFTAMIEGIRKSSINKGLIDQKTFDDGISGLYRTTEVDGSFLLYLFQGNRYKKANCRTWLLCLKKHLIAPRNVCYYVLN